MDLDVPLPSPVALSKLLGISSVKVPSLLMAYEFMTNLGPQVTAAVGQEYYQRFGI